MTTATATVLAAHMGGGSPAVALIVFAFIVACLATGPTARKDDRQ